MLRTINILFCVLSIFSSVFAQQSKLSIRNSSKDRTDANIKIRSVEQLYNTAKNAFYSSDYVLVDSLIPLLELKVNNSDKKGSGMLWELKGRRLEKKGEYDQAVNCYQKALQLYIEIKDKSLEIPMYNLMGVVYAESKFYKAAEKYFRTGLNLAKQNNERKESAILETNLGGLFMESRKLDSAKKYLERGLLSNLAINNFDRVSSTYSSLGALHFMRGDTGIAISYVKNAQEFAAKDSSLTMLAASNLQLGKIYFAIKNYKESIPYLLESIELAEKSQDKRIMMVGYLNLGKSYYGTGDYKKAYDFVSIGEKLEDELLGGEKENLLQKLKDKYEAEITEKENEKLTLELESKSKQYIYIIIAALILLILIVVIIISLGLRNRANKYKLEIQKERLKVKDLLVAQKQGKIKELKASIQETNMNAESLSVENTPVMISRLIEEKNWAQFMIEFKLNYGSFVEKLTGRHPELTSKDLRILALIKLNLIDKEIADILNIEYASFRKSKSRLKKKLDLPLETSVTDYIVSI